MEYDDSNRGAMFLNERKTTERHPDWNGKINIHGTDYWLSGWKKQGQKGPYLSLSLGEPCERQRDKPESPPPRTAPRTTTSKYPSTHPANDSDIPW